LAHDLGENCLEKRRPSKYIVCVYAHRLLSLEELFNVLTQATLRLLAL